MGRNSLTFWTSSLKGRLGGAACSPVSDGSSDLEFAKEEAEVSVLCSSCSRARRGDCSLGGRSTVSCCSGCEEEAKVGTIMLEATAWMDCEAMAEEPFTTEMPFLTSGWVAETEQSPLVLPSLQLVK